jgi:hypothetical protein
MARMNFKNTFGSQIGAGGTGLDLQRVDLFKLTLVLPSALNLDWTENVEFAVEKFPIPERSREMIAVKYMQQTNYLIGATRRRQPWKFRCAMLSPSGLPRPWKSGSGLSPTRRRAVSA